MADIEFGQLQADFPAYQNTGSIKINNVIPLPQGYKSFPRFVALSGTGLGTTPVGLFTSFSASGSTNYALRYMTRSQMAQVNGTSTTGIPSSYTILGDTLRFMPKPDAEYTSYMNYYKSFDALSSSVATNYILEKHPAIYLYGSLFHAANFLGGIEPQRLAKWEAMYGTALERLELNDREDQFSGSPLQMRGDDTVASPFKTISTKNY